MDREPPKCLVVLTERAWASRQDAVLERRKLRALRFNVVKWLEYMELHIEIKATPVKH